MPYEPKRPSASRSNRTSPSTTCSTCSRIPRARDSTSGTPRATRRRTSSPRYKRMRGFNVLHPMGWDAFGLPAEQYAIKTGTHPRETTQPQHRHFRAQIARSDSATTGRAKSTPPTRATCGGPSGSSSGLYERGLAYQAEVPVNWCPALGTVLANEEVIDGKSERGGAPRRAGADEAVDAPHHGLRRSAPRGSRRRSTGPSHQEDAARLDRPQRGRRNPLRHRRTTRARRSTSSRRAPTPCSVRPTWCSRPSTRSSTRLPRRPARKAVDAYVEQRPAQERARSHRRGRREDGRRHRRGADQPGQRRTHPVWIADYVLATYGTGAIMAVPGHDERDFEFAETFELPIRRGRPVRRPRASYDGGGDGERQLRFPRRARDRRRQATHDRVARSERAAAKGTVTYKLRDWLFSRQRYWGEPFPVLHTRRARRLVPDETLPLTHPRAR